MGCLFPSDKVVSLNKDTLPPVTGVPRNEQAFVIPSQDFANCQYPKLSSGEAKLRLLVTAKGIAPTQLIFLEASATEAIAPLSGSKETHRFGQSTTAAIPLLESESPLFIAVSYTHLRAHET